MFSVTYKPFKLSVIKLSVIAPSVIVPSVIAPSDSAKTKFEFILKFQQNEFLKKKSILRSRLTFGKIARFIL